MRLSDLRKLGKMNLTFKGFLRNYCRELTGLDTNNLKKLLTAVNTTAPSAAEALFLFAVLQNKTDYLIKISLGSWVHEQYKKTLHDSKEFNSINDYLTSDAAPERYKKVWNAFCAKKYAVETNRRVIMLMREKTLAAMKATSLTAYTICKKLNLNLGNVYAYLHSGDVTKVSRATARRIMQFALNSEKANH